MEPGRQLCSYSRSSQHFINAKVHYRVRIPSRPIQSISLQQRSELSTHLHIALPSELFPSGFPTDNLYAFLFPRSRYMPCPAHIILFGLTIPVTSLLRTQFSDILSLCSFTNFREQGDDDDDNNNNNNNNNNNGARGSIVVKALCYKPEGRGFDTR
jgi:hypothetical protein